MEKFIIEGGAPLSGTIIPAGNKNAALPALAATLLTAEEVVLRNVPRIRDVEAMVELLVNLGARAEWRDENVISVTCDEISHTQVDAKLSQFFGLLPRGRFGIEPVPAAIAPFWICQIET